MRNLFIRAGLMCEFEETSVGWQAVGLILLLGFLVFLWALSAQA